MDANQPPLTIFDQTLIRFDYKEISWWGNAEQKNKK